MHTVHTFPPYFPEIHFNTIFQSMPCLSSGLFLQVFWTKFCMHFSSLPCVLYALLWRTTRMKRFCHQIWGGWQQIKYEDRRGDRKTVYLEQLSEHHSIYHMICSASSQPYECDKQQTWYNVTCWICLQIWWLYFTLMEIYYLYIV